jgi:hypothetical protein
VTACSLHFSSSQEEGISTISDPSTSEGGGFKFEGNAKKRKKEKKKG